MYVLGIVSFVHDVEFGLPCSVALFEEFLGVRDIVNQVLRDLQSSDDLKVSIDGN